LIDRGHLFTPAAALPMIKLQQLLPGPVQIIGEKGNLAIEPILRV
jgi:hypothetical protein